MPLVFSRRALHLLHAALVTLVALTLSASSVRAQSYWFERYEHAVTMIDAGRFAEASGLLRDLIQRHPVPIVGMRVPGDRFIDYLPYYERARIHVAEGNFPAAAHDLDISEALVQFEKDGKIAKDIAELRRTIAQGRGAARVNPMSSPSSTSAATTH